MFVFTVYSHYKYTCASHIIQYTVYIMQNTIYSIHHALYNIQYTSHIIQYTVYIMHYTPYNYRATYYGFTARVRARTRAIPADTCLNGTAVRACIRAGIARIQASTRCSKSCTACFENDSSSVHKTDGCILYASPFHKHPGVTPSETFVLRLQCEEICCDFGLIFYTSK